ncbi:MAG TPA: tripartite tricarboxylate transporter substrate binding protein [Ramlibacter sp.]|nr:tripartite tricarboxylate transporter substrate binding protein [Ramlibacter sp.]
MKKMWLETFRAALCVVSLAGGVLPAAHAQAFPNRPIRIVVPFPAGGVTDPLARFIGTKLTEQLGQPVVIDNRPGGNSVIGASAVATAPADGHTLLLTTESTLVANPALYEKLAYDPVKDFEPITVIAAAEQFLVVHPSLNASTLGAFMELARSKPGALTYGSSGTGSAMHLNMETFKSASGLNILHVPYKGGAPALTDLLGGQISMMILSTGSIRQHVDTGKLVAIAVGTPRRSVNLPNVPTFAEAGLPNYEFATAWLGLLAPAGTPKPVIATLNSAVTKALESPEFRQRFSPAGLEPVGGSPQSFADLMKREAVRWTRMVKATGAQLN